MAAPHTHPAPAPGSDAMTASLAVGAFWQGVGLHLRYRPHKAQAHITRCAVAAWIRLSCPHMFTVVAAGRLWRCYIVPGGGYLRVVGAPGGGCLLALTRAVKNDN